MESTQVKKNHKTTPTSRIKKNLLKWSQQRRRQQEPAKCQSQQRRHQERTRKQRRQHKKQQQHRVARATTISSFSKNRPQQQQEMPALTASNSWQEQQQQERASPGDRSPFSIRLNNNSLHRSQRADTMPTQHTAGAQLCNHELEASLRVTYDRGSK